MCYYYQQTQMDVKRMSRTFVSKIQQNLRPLSVNLIPISKSKSEIQFKHSNDLPLSMKKIDIESTYKIIKENTVLDSKSNIKIITCLKGAHKNWDDYVKSPNKNGQLACIYEMKLKRIQMKYQEELSKLIVQGDLNKIKKQSEILKPMIDYLQKKSRKFKQHESQFKIISKKSEEMSQQNEIKEDQIKQQMMDLVEKFKKYAVNINQNLANDTTVIKQIGQSQDKQLASLQTKTSSMEQIIKQQKLGFFQLIGMGIIAIVLWVIGLMIIIIV